MTWRSIVHVGTATFGQVRPGSQTKNSQPSKEGEKHLMQFLSVFCDNIVKEL